MTEQGLLPYPSQVEWHTGSLALSRGLFVVNYLAARSERLESAVERITGQVRRRATAMNDGQPVTLEIDCGEPGQEWPSLGEDESYRLEVTDELVNLRAATEWGVLHGLNTLAQLVTPTGNLPTVLVEDTPRFPWRGLMIDVARHFIGIGVLRRTLDVMACYKLNVLHLHLTDDQAFRLRSRTFPRLASEPSYTSAELAGLVGYAAARGIRVIPELDMPGHSTSWLAAYPEWGNERTEATRRYGVHPGCLDPTSETVYEAIAALLGELDEIFPDRYVHIGGDEVHPAWWSGSESIRAFMRANGLADVVALQAHFNARVTGLVNDLGKVAVGWDEILHPDLTGGVLVQSWRGATARDRVLRQGHDCLVSAGYYLDLCFPADVHYRFDPEADEKALIELEDALTVDPRFEHVGAGMRWTDHWRQKGSSGGSSRGSVIGGEACLWSELVDESVLDARLWSRLPVVAERFWSPAAQRDIEDLYRRFTASLESLRASGLVDVFESSRALLARAGVTDVWMPLVSLLEPVKWYGRLLGEKVLSERLRGTEMPQSRPYDADTPLDRIVDGLLPESFIAREVNELSERVADGDEEAMSVLGDLARSWMLLSARPDCPEELAPLAESLAEVAGIVLDVLQGKTIDESVLQRAGRPHGEYLLAIVPGLSRWLTAPDQ
ncbi:MAG: family 20 glycosylhydrolase [Gammaproteobacteria bacterium]|nr:family 20 glycosylhydrolase [Gammaproteobacteria bacterium]